jgi:hypothetical protein
MAFDHGEVLVELTEKLGGESVVFEGEHKMLVVGGGGRWQQALLMCVQAETSIEFVQLRFSRGDPAIS